jgi:hypothetical protein
VGHDGKRAALHGSMHCRERRRDGRRELPGLCTVKLLLDAGNCTGRPRRRVVHTRNAAQHLQVWLIIALTTRLVAAPQRFREVRTECTSSRNERAVGGERWTGAPGAHHRMMASRQQRSALDGRGAACTLLNKVLAPMPSLPDRT